MRALSLKDIIEYIAASVVIIFAFFIIALLYAFFNIESFSQYMFQQFTNSLLIDRLNYCLYESTKNPFLLFYAPNMDIINKHNDTYQKCFMNISGTFYYFINQTNESNKLKYTYLNFSYKDYIYFFFYNINNINKSYSYDPYNLSFKYNVSVVPYKVAYNIYNISYTYDGNLPALNQFLINYFHNYSLYIHNETKNAYQNYEIINNEIIISYVGYDGFYYDEVYIHPLVSYYIVLPEYNSGELVIVSLYGVGYLYMNGIYDMVCDMIAGGQINISSCKVTKIR